MEPNPLTPRHRFSDLIDALKAGTINVWQVLDKLAYAVDELTDGPVDDGTTPRNTIKDPVTGELREMNPVEKRDPRWSNRDPVTGALKFEPVAPRPGSTPDPDRDPLTGESPRDPFAPRPGSTPDPNPPNTGQPVNLTGAPTDRNNRSKRSA